VKRKTLFNEISDQYCW